VNYWFHETGSKLNGLDSRYLKRLLFTDEVLVTQCNIRSLRIKFILYFLLSLEFKQLLMSVLLC